MRREEEETENEEEEAVWGSGSGSARNSVIVLISESMNVRVSQRKDGRSPRSLRREGEGEAGLGVELAAGLREDQARMNKESHSGHNYERSRSRAS